MHLLILHMAYVFGGAERSTASFLSDLDRTRIKRITLIAPAVLRPFFSKGYEHFIDATAYQLKSGFTNLAALHRDAQTVGELLCELEPDVAFGMMHYASALVAFGARLTGARARTIAAYRSPFYEHILRYEQDLQRRDFLQAIVAEAALMADRVVVPSQGMADELKQRFRIPIDRIAVIPNGIDLAKITEATQAAIPELADLDQSQTPILCAIARLAPEKNLGLLLEAFQRVHAVCPSILIILGDGSEREGLEAKAVAWGLVDAIRFLGHRDSVYPYLRRADVLIHTCQYEGFGNTILEALACGTAVVATDCPHGPREVLDHGEYGVLVPPDNPDKLAEGILCLLSNPAKRQILAARGLERAKQLSIRRMMDSYETEFLKLSGLTTSDQFFTPRERNLYFNLSYNNFLLMNEVNPCKFVHVCMVTYNRLEFTRQSLEALFRHTDFPYILTVVDNGSNDGTIEYLQFLYEKNLIKNLMLFGANVGIAKAANVGWVCEPEADYYIKFDNDVVMRGPWLAAMVDVADSIPRVGAVAYNVENFSFPPSVINGRSVRLKGAGNLSGACMMVPKAVHEKLGFWCEDYGLYGEEDADYGHRIHCARLLNVYMADEDLAFHLPSGKNAVIDPITLESRDGGEENFHPDYRAWKDRLRHKNVNQDAFFSSNIHGYTSGEQSLYVGSQFARRWLLHRHVRSNWNDLWFDNIHRIALPMARVSRNYESLSVVFSTREADPSWFVGHIKNTVGLSDIEVISYVNNKGEFSLSELYNKGLREAQHNIVVFVHDDVVFNQENWGLQLLKSFQSTGYGILGIAGATDLFKDQHNVALAWWEAKGRVVGKIRHEVDGKTAETVYSNRYDDPVPVICLDGVFIAVDKHGIRKFFNEEFKGFHYYDIAFTFANHLSGVDVGVVFDIDLTHKSGGKLDMAWQKSRLLFSKLYRDSLPHGIKPKKIDYDARPIEKFNSSNALVSIIIPTKDKIEILIDCIDSVINHTHIAQYEIVIADTGSTRENKEKLSEWIGNVGGKPNLSAIRLVEYNYYNFAKINNDVVKNHLSKKSDYVLFCNNDIKLLNDAVDRCLSLFGQNRKNSIGTVGIRLHYADNSIQHNGIEMLVGFGKAIGFSHRNLRSYYTYDSKLIEVMGNTAAFLMIERSVFEKCYFNENYNECLEDIELNLEMLRLGRKNYQIGHAVAYHYESQTRNLGSDKDKKIIDDYQKNLVPYFKKTAFHCSFLSYLRVLPELRIWATSRPRWKSARCCWRIFPGTRMSIICWV